VEPTRFDTISRFTAATTEREAAWNAEIESLKASRGENFKEINLGTMLATAIEKKREEAVNHPPHYLKHPSGVECIQITEHMNFCLGNAIKYIWRAGLKADDPVQDLSKALWYIQREIARLEQK
jgi:hypothetical protein